MLPLSKLQQTFADWVLRGGSQNSMSAAIKTNGLTAEQRLQVYRNNTQLGLTEALRDGYPVVNKLVGTEFFGQLARSYIRHYPPKAGCLLSFGGEFADFTADFASAAGLPYLPDVARLEWLWHEAFHEYDAPALDMAKLAMVAPDAYGKLGFTLHPSARFLASDFPILKIWQANQEGHEGEGHINLNEGGCQLVVYRPQWEVDIMPLDEANYLFLAALDRKQTLTEAIVQAITNDPSFDVQARLQRWLANGLITDFFINN